VAWTPEYRRRKLAEDPNFNRRRALKYRYGLSLEAFYGMIVDQSGRCRLCRKEFGSKTPIVDHDHETGEIRGLLCRSCNSLLGWYEASVERIREYLKERAA
jgi:hypothetical protein